MNESGSRWQIHLKRQPEKILRRLPKDLAHRIDQALLSLSDDPFPPQSKALANVSNLYRVRVGDWCIIYVVNEQLIVLIVRIAPRGDAYRNL